MSTVAGVFAEPEGTYVGIGDMLFDKLNPERVVDPLLGSADGLRLFESMLARVPA